MIKSGLADCHKMTVATTKNMFYKATTEIYGVQIIQNVQHTTFLQGNFANFDFK